MRLHPLLQNDTLSFNYFSRMILVLSIDSAIGRIDKNMLSDQELMEIVFAEITGAEHRFKDLCGDFVDACVWRGVKCDADGNVVSFHDISDALQGTFYVDCIPPKLRTFCLRGVGSPGTIDAARLPINIESFNISDNAFSGTVDFQNLPTHLVAFRVHSNSFTGSANLDDLPPKLQKLEISQNRFSGSVLLTKLPSNLNLLHFGGNEFSGEIHIANVPHRCVLNGSKNAFSGTAYVPEDCFAFLCETKISKIMDENGERHHEESQMLRGW